MPEELLEIFKEEVEASSRSVQNTGEINSGGISRTMVELALEIAAKNPGKNPLDNYNHGDRYWCSEK